MGTLPSYYSIGTGMLLAQMPDIYAHRQINCLFLGQGLYNCCRDTSFILGMRHLFFDDVRDII